MREVKFYLSERDMDRLFAIKKLQGRDNMTGEDFAGLLLENELHRLFPDQPEFDEDGEIQNAEKYTGLTKADIDEMKKTLIFLG